mmetsp:Transcript_15771/g.19213  ORF Transcript_15771/g.19213 Transcript_15771/m.19213 type:complete len:80 (-) Transcript_15771:245-484(-)
METVTSPVAGTVHIETNVGGHTTESLANSTNEDSVSCFKKGIIKALDSGCRFSILNFWRNADNERRPISRAPLTVLKAP